MARTAYHQFIAAYREKHGVSGAEARRVWTAANDTAKENFKQTLSLEDFRVESKEEKSGKKGAIASAVKRRDHCRRYKKALCIAAASDGCEWIVGRKPGCAAVLKARHDIQANEAAVAAPRSVMRKTSEKVIRKGGRLYKVRKAECVAPIGHWVTGKGCFAPAKEQKTVRFQEASVAAKTRRPVVYETLPPTTEPFPESKSAEPVAERTSAEPVAERTSAEPVAERTSAEPLLEGKLEKLVPERIVKSLNDSLQVLSSGTEDWSHEEAVHFATTAPEGRYVVRKSTRRPGLYRFYVASKHFRDQWEKLQSVPPLLRIHMMPVLEVTVDDRGRFHFKDTASEKTYATRYLDEGLAHFLPNLAFTFRWQPPTYAVKI